jgi:stage V sporulation protein D (sporulation-specific penicillin-binding protein)
MHRLENVGPVELATMSFGQSFQITPMQLLTATAATVNGGYVITPHVGLRLEDADGNIVHNLAREQGEQIISAETSQIMVDTLKNVVDVGTGNRTYLPGMRIGGKTATSEKLPRRSGKYVASFITFAPADNPQVMAFVLIDEPKGAYYGGQVAGPVMKSLLQSILPYLNIEPILSETEIQKDGEQQIPTPDLINQNRNAALKIVRDLKLDYELRGTGNTVGWQFPTPGEPMNADSKIIIFLE